MDLGQGSNICMCTCASEGGDFHALRGNSSLVCIQTLKSGPHMVMQPHMLHRVPKFHAWLACYPANRFP